MVTKGQWRDYENGKKKEYGEFIRKARELVYVNASPWHSNQNNRGQPVKNDPRALVICLLLKIWLWKPYRDIVSFLPDSTYPLPVIWLRRVPWKDGSAKSDEPSHEGVSHPA